MFAWLRQYVCDRVYLWRQWCPVITRVDKRGGTYFWVKGPAKDILRQIKPQMRGHYKRARFGGIYVRHPAVAKEVYEAFSQQCHFPIARYAVIGGNGVTLIDT